jgi:predicted NAD/FAD-binding protein
LTRQRIAIIGSGISGIGTALALAPHHDITLFEKDDRLGGHANTVEIDYPTKDGSTPVRVDTGFIVYNEKTYPNLTAFFEHYDVPTEWSDMSLSFAIDGGRIEWAADNLDKIFAQRRNILRPSFVTAMRSVLRFNREAQQALASSDPHDEAISDWLDARGYGEAFRRFYLYPMAGAIWSTRSADIAAFPARNLFAFYENHDLFTGLGDAVQWRTVTGGSRSYVDKAAAILGQRIRRNAPVSSVTTGHDGATVTLEDGERISFDQVVMATHSDEALALRNDADDETRALLSAIRYTPNRAVLHRDETLMPRIRKTWSSWNTRVGGDADTSASLTYWMNRLQNIDRDKPLFVTLNPTREPAAGTILSEHEYAHPFFDRGAFDAQRAFDRVQGRGGIWYTGAWLGYGFHEDGLRSAVRVAAALGIAPDWARDGGVPILAERAAA